METGKLKKFAQAARRTLRGQVTAKLALVLGPESAARRERLETVKKLEEAIRNSSKDQVIERVAYIWFNRFCALRFMDVNRYTRIGVVSPAEGQSQPEILAEAKMGLIDEELTEQKTRQHILDLLAGKAPSADPQGEAYRTLLVASCNYWHRAMPFLFERIDDYTELLLPEGLLSANSILEATREAMTSDACEDVEVIGWLYQFYISEKKDEVFDGLKKNKKIMPENIPAATQLFTPHWIVRYLVENSLGRLWLLNRPGSKLAEQMDYYIKPEQPETDFLKISSPEEIKICDPACGSGHMLTYAFDLLYAIYEEEGYEPAEVPEKILTNNLYGIEIDERAGELAAFALTMKARAKQRRFFNKGVKPNICVLENVRFSPTEMQDVAAIVGKRLFTDELSETLRQFEQAKSFGSLIVQKLRDPAETLRAVEARYLGSDLLMKDVQDRLLTVLRMAEALSSKYHVLVANPPYSASRGLHNDIQDFAKKNYSEAKADLYAMFIARGMKMCERHGYISMITMHGWLFLSSFEAIRSRVLSETRILSLLQIGFNSFPELNSKVALGAAFSLQNSAWGGRGEYFNLNDAAQTADKGKVFLEKMRTKKLFSIDSKRFAKIPGSPLAFWLGENIIALYEGARVFGEVVDSRQGLATADNDRFLRRWFEVGSGDIAFGTSSQEAAAKSEIMWFPINKGGNFRRWYGNHEQVVNWQHGGRQLHAFKPRAVIRNPDYYFKSSVSWSDVTFKNSFRLYPAGFIFDATGHSAFWQKEDDKWVMLSYCNNKVCEKIVAAINPTMHFHIGYFDSLPWPENLNVSDAKRISMRAIEISHSDWDAFAAAVKHCVASESIYAASFSDVVCWTSSSRSGLRATE